MRRDLKVIAIAVLFALAASGCGGDDSPDAGPSTVGVSEALLHAGFVDRADRICTQGRTQLILTGNRAFGSLPANQDPSDEAIRAYAEQHAIPILRRQYGKLRQLRPPPGDKAAIGHILDLADKGIAQLQADPTILLRGSGIPPALEQARQRAFEYGLGSCGAQIEHHANGGQLKLKR